MRRCVQHHKKHMPWTLSRVHGRPDGDSNGCTYSHAYHYTIVGSERRANLGSHECSHYDSNGNTHIPHFVAYIFTNRGTNARMFIIPP